MAWRRVGLMLCAALAGGLTALAPLEQAVQGGVAPVGGLLFYTPGGGGR